MVWACSGLRRLWAFLRQCHCSSHAGGCGLRLSAWALEGLHPGELYACVRVSGVLLDASLSLSLWVYVASVRAYSMC